MQQPKATKATRALFDSLKENGQISSSVDYGKFAIAFETRPDYQQRVYDYYKGEGYEVPGSAQEFVEMYRLKDAVVPDDATTTERNLVNMARPAMGPPTISGEPREAIEQSLQAREAVEAQLTTDAIAEARQKMTDEYLQSNRVQNHELSLGNQVSPYDRDIEPAAPPQIRADLSQAPAAVAAPEQASRDQLSMRNQATGGNVMVPDIQPATSDEGNVQLVDFRSPDFRVINTDQAGIEQMWNTLSQEMTGKPYADLNITERAAINQIMTERYVPKEIGDDILADLGYDRDASAWQTFGNNLLRAGATTFTDAGAGMAERGAIEANRDYVTVPGGTFMTYNPGAGQQSDGEIRQEVFGEAEKMREAINRRLTINPDHYDSFWLNTAPAALGSAGAFVGTALATRGLGTIGSGAMTANLGVQSMRTQGYNQAIMEGATEEEANRVGAVFGVLGATEAIPILGALNRFGKVAKSLNKTTPMRAFYKGVGSQMAEEGIQEATSQFLQQLTLQEVLDLTDQLNGEEIFDALAGGMLAGGVMGLPGGVYSAYKTNLEQRAARAVGEEEERLRVRMMEIDRQYVDRVVRHRDEALERINPEIDRLEGIIASVPEDSNAPGVVRAKEQLEDLKALRQDLVNGLDNVIEHNRAIQSIDPSQYIDPAGEIGRTATLADQVLNQIKQQNNEAVERLSDQGGQEESEGQAQEEGSSTEGAESQNQQAEEVDGSEESVPQVLPSQGAQETTPSNAGETNTGTVRTPPSGSESSTGPNTGESVAAERSAPEPQHPRPKQASDEEVSLIERARSEGEDSQYKGERNKVRRVLRPDGTVEYAIKETAKTTSIIRENEEGNLVRKNLNTGKETPLGPSSALAKAYYRGREQGLNASPQEAAEGSNTSKPAPPATSTAVEPPTSQASQTATAPAVDPAPAEAAPASEKTLEQRARIRPNDRRFVEQIPESIRSRVITDLAGDTDASTFDQFLAEQPQEDQDAYKARVRAANPVLLRHRTAKSKKKVNNRKEAEKTRRNKQSGIHAEIERTKLAEKAKDQYGNIPKPSLKAVQDAVRDAVSEDPGISNQEIEEVFQDALDENPGLRKFVTDVANALMNMESVTQAAEEMGFSNPADFAKHIAERMLLSGANPKTKFVEDGNGRVRTQSLTSAAQVILQEAKQGNLYSKISRSFANNTVSLEVARPEDGSTPAKRPQEIINDLRKGAGVRMTYKAIKGAYGYFNKASKRIFIEYKSDLGAFMHEMTHYMDDKFGTTSGTMTPRLIEELSAWAQTAEQYNADNPASITNLQEGFAKYLENYVINPAEAQRLSPEIHALYEQMVPQEMREQIEQFSEAYRNYYFADQLTTDALNIESISSPNADPNQAEKKSRRDRRKAFRERSGAATRTKEEGRDVGRFNRRKIRLFGAVFTMSANIDVLPRMYTEAMVTTLRNTRQLYEALGYDETTVVDRDGRRVVPMKLLENAIAQRLGRGSMIEQAITNGLLDPNAQSRDGNPQRYKDEKGRIISWAYIYEAFAQNDPGQMKKDQDAMETAIMAERIVEITARRIMDAVQGDRKVRDELAKVGFPEDLMSDPEISILGKALRIQDAITRYNAAAETKIDMPVVAGAGILDQSDLDRAITMLQAEEVLRKGNEAQQSQYARIQDGKKRYRAVADMLLRFMRDSGRISDKDYQTIKDNNQYYAAMNRIHGLTPDIQNQKKRQNFTGGYGLLNVDSPIKRAQGSQQTIQDPMRSLFQNVGRILNEVTRNEVVATFMEAFVDEAGTSTDADLVSDAAGIAMEITRQVEMEDGGTRRLKGNEINHNDAHASGKVIQQAFINGEERWFLVDRVVASELDVMYDIQMLDNTFMNAITSMVRMYKSMITLFPGFIVKNAIRDVPTTAMMSNVPGYMGLDGWSGIFDEQLRADFEASGASQAGHFVRHAAGFEATQKHIWSQRGENGSVNWAVFRPSSGRAGDAMRQNPFGRKVVEKYNWTKNRVYQESEEFNRRREYNRAYKYATESLGLDPYMAARYAAAEARGILDYARGGVASKFLNQFLPFFNARAQGIRKFGDLLAKATTNRQRAMVTALRFGSLVVLPTMVQMLALAGTDDEEGNVFNQYANLPDWQRFYFWNFKVGPNNWMSIPKPFDFATVGTGIESIILRMATGDEKYTDGLIGEMFKAFSPITMDQVLGAGGPLKLVTELPANYKFFYETNIAPVYEEGKAPQLRTDRDRASAFGRGIQDMFRMFGADINARKADYAFETIFGSWGKFATKATGDNPLSALGYMAGIMRNNPTFSSKDYQDYMNLIKYADLRNIQPYKDHAEFLSEIMTAYIETDDQERKESLTNIMLQEVSAGAKVWRDEEQREELANWRAVERELNR